VTTNDQFDVQDLIYSPYLEDFEANP